MTSAQDYVNNAKVKAELRRKEENKKKKTVLSSNEIAVRFLEIQHKKCFNFTRIRIYDENNINVPILDFNSGWTGNYDVGEPNKDLQRKLTLDLGKNVNVGRIFFDQYGNGHSSRYYPDGAVVILKASNGKLIPTQYLDGKKLLSKNGTTDLRYNLSLKPADFTKTMNEINLKKDEKLKKVKETQDATKKKAEELINKSKEKVNKMKVDSEIKTKNKKYSTEQKVVESQKKNKCKATNQIYKIKFKTMQTYCSNMGNTAESIDARCKNLVQSKDPECFTNVKFCNKNEFHQLLISFITFSLVTCLFIKWINCKR
jgi:hypothetical protein